MKNQIIRVLFYFSFALFIYSCNENRDSKSITKYQDSVIKMDTPAQIEGSTTSESENDCPLIGCAKSKNLQELNTLKNRTEFPKSADFNTNITLVSLLKNGEDTDRWKNSSAAKIIGYVRDVKAGGIETTNCKSKDRALRDTHIELVLNPMSAEKKECLVVEITPRLRKIMAAKGEDWSTKMLRSKYLGRWVEIEGWLLFDFEHWNMAENTHPNNIKNWRGTAWEIHPITKIKIAETH